MTTKSLVTDSAFTELKRFVIATTGLTYFSDKDEDLGMRLQKRLDALSLQSCRAYLDRLREGPDAAGEFERLATELTIGETYFFRHEEQFDDLRTTIIPELIARNQMSRRLHIWCAGCSIGAEPYSIAILLEEHFGTALAGWDVRIVATDINRDFLERAARGVFDEWAFRTTKPEFRQRHFTPSGKAWAIKPVYRRPIEFRFHNLITHPWTCSALTGDFDFIICRNVMIYFDALTNAKVTAFFETALVNGGWLVIGHAELAQDLTHFELRQLPRVTAYRKTAVAQPSVHSFLLSPPIIDEAPVITAPLPPLPRPVLRSREDQTAYLRTLANAGEFELAVVSATELIDRDPTNAVAFYYRALVRMQTGGNAEADLVRAIGIEPKFVMAHYQASLYFEKQGARDVAIRHRRRVLELLDALTDQDPLPEGDDLRVADLRAMINNRREVA